MKCSIIIGEKDYDEVVIYAREKTELVTKIEQLVNGNTTSIMGYKNGEITPLENDEIYCFIVENGKVFAITKEEKYLLKTRLYKIEETLDNDFIKLNQSSIANIKKIKKFDSSILGELKVVFKNGYVDYVSRRNIKKIKERLGL